MSILNNGINSNSITPLSSTQGGSGVSNPTAHGILISEGSSGFNPITLTNGQLLIGSTGVDPVASTLTAGSGISISNGSGSITITNSINAGGGFLWNDTTGTSATIVAGNGYVSDNASLVTFTLPATSTFGDSFAIAGKSAGGWTIAQNAGQQINVGNVATTTGTGGSVSSTNRYDNVTLVCVTAGSSSVWVLRSSFGNLSVV
jgi:hypothetical protein